jgi:hypothetical protein
VRNGVNHAANNQVVLFDYEVADALQSEAANSFALVRLATDCAFDLGNL